MVVTAAAQRRLEALRRRSGSGCIGFRFDGIIGSCSFSKPILEPVQAPVPGAGEFRLGDLFLYAAGEPAEMLENATVDYDPMPLFGRGLTVRWPHREGGCPNCR